MNKNEYEEENDEVSIPSLTVICGLNKYAYPCKYIVQLSIFIGIEAAQIGWYTYFVRRIHKAKIINTSNHNAYRYYKSTISLNEQKQCSEVKCMNKT